MTRLLLMTQEPQRSGETRMIYAIDIGNTNITLGVFGEDSDAVINYANFKTDKQMTTDDFGLKFHDLLGFWKASLTKSDAVLITSVVPSLDYPVIHMFEKYFNVAARSVKASDFPIQIHYDYPQEIGSDRIVDAYAAMKLYPDKNLIIVDFGTATTLDVLTAEGVYEGGVIFPGVMTSLRSLSDAASKLPHIDLSVPTKVVGKNTVDGIRSGIVHGTGAMLDELVVRISAEMGWKDYVVLATGGLSEMIRSASKSITVIDRHLTLKGLYYFRKSENAK